MQSTKRNFDLVASFSTFPFGDRDVLAGARLHPGKKEMPDWSCP